MKRINKEQISEPEVSVFRLGGQEVFTHLITCVSLSWEPKPAGITQLTVTLLTGHYYSKKFLLGKIKITLLLISRIYETSIFKKIIDHAANLLSPLHTRSLCEIQPITGHSSRLPSKSHLVPPSLTILAWTLLSPSQGPSLSLPANKTFTLNQTPNHLRILSFPAPLQYATKTLSG